MTTITFLCGECGKTYQTDAAHAGRRTRCKQCGTPLVIPAPAAPDDEDDGGMYALADEPPGASGSGADVDPEAGSAWRPSPEDPDDAPAVAPPPPGPARRKRRKKKRRRAASDDPSRPAEVSDAVILAVLGGLVAALITWAAFDPNAIVLVAILLLLGGFLVSSLGNVAIARATFEEDLIVIVLFRVFPLFRLYYLFTRWAQLKGAFIAILVGTAMMVLGGLLFLGKVEKWF